jgi:hypothetical protein
MAENEVAAGWLVEWAKDTLAEWLPTYHDQDNCSFKVVRMYDDVGDVYEIRYSDAFSQPVGKYRIYLTVEEVPGGDDPHGETPSR